MAWRLLGGGSNLALRIEPQDSIRVPQRKAPCDNCREVTIHVHVYDKWLCLSCGEPFESKEPLTRDFKANLLLRGLGSVSALRVLLALRGLGEAHVRGIGRAAGITSPSAIKRALHRLYEAELVSRRTVPIGIQAGRVRCFWSLNRVHPATQKILAVLEDTQ